MIASSRIVVVLIVLIGGVSPSWSHNSGSDCLHCHPNLKLGGTLYSDYQATSTATANVELIRADSMVYLLNAQTNGNIASPLIEGGSYLVTVGEAKSKTWHQFPAQASCNKCHKVYRNYPIDNPIFMPANHTRIPSDNICLHCHHFPASMQYDRIYPKGTLNVNATSYVHPTSAISLLGRSVDFNPETFDIQTVRPDVFNDGYFSMFDVILAAALSANIPIEYHFDESAMTHVIDKFNGQSGKYWYHFAFDSGSGRSNEIKFKRENRWDELLWRPGAWVQLVEGEDLDGILAEYHEEIQREQQYGHVIPAVNISVNATPYQSSPQGSGRIRATRQYRNLVITSHGWRAPEYPSIYPKPFKPEVVTALDVLLTLQDIGELTSVEGAFYDCFNNNYINSYYVVEMGFPNEGVAHASGRQGFTYSAGNGTQNQLANNADRKVHVTSDILVLHAPDFCRWNWTELGDPYYEQRQPAGITENEYNDQNAADKGGFLYPILQHTDNIEIAFNVFEPGDFKLSIYDLKGSLISKIINNHYDLTGIFTIRFETNNLSSGIYFVSLAWSDYIQSRTLVILR